jgi:hypothetical protein
MLAISLGLQNYRLRVDGEFTMSTVELWPSGLGLQKYSQLANYAGNRDVCIQGKSGRLATLIYSQISSWVTATYN